jgi:hypothetical protein
MVQKQPKLKAWLAKGDVHALPAGLCDCGRQRLQVMTSSVMVNIKQEPSLIVFVMLDGQKAIQYVPRGRTPVRGLYDVNLNARNPKEVEILLRCECIIAGDYEQPVITKTAGVP